jgi:hypothetical protein
MPARTWEELEATPPRQGLRLRWRQVSARPFSEFRRLDGLSRLAALAVESLGLEHYLDASQRRNIPILIASRHGCLDTDLRFAQSLAAGDIAPALFPYTLPSTCLGELAIRWQLRGPLLALAGAEPIVEALREAAYYLAAGEAEAVLAVAGDYLPQDSAVTAQTEPLGYCLAMLVEPAKRFGQRLLPNGQLIDVPTTAALENVRTTLQSPPGGSP